jgi:hypothetical protein
MHRVNEPCETGCGVASNKKRKNKLGTTGSVKVHWDATNPIMDEAEHHHIESTLSRARAKTEIERAITETETMQ